MCSRQIIHFTPNWADFVGLTAIQTNAVIQDHAAHGFTFHFVIVAANQLFILYQVDFFIFGVGFLVGFHILVYNFSKRFNPKLLVFNLLFSQIVAGRK